MSGQLPLHMPEGGQLPPAKAAGKTLKAAALREHEAQHAVMLLRARRAFLMHLLNVRPESTIEPIRPAVDTGQVSCSKFLGAVPGPLVRAGIIGRCGWAKSERRERHAAVLSVWRLLDADKAQAWLAAHPVN